MFAADGGGGASVSALGSALNVGAIMGMSAEAGKLLAAAKSGGFKITPEGVKPLRDALDGMQMDLMTLNQDITPLTQAPQLGSHAYAHTIAAHDQKGASSEADSAIAVIDSLKQVIQQATEALDRAAGLYNEAEHQAIAATSNIQG